MAVVSLSDYNRKQIEDLQQEQRDMTEQFEKQKEGVCVCACVKVFTESDFYMTSCFQHSGHDQGCRNCLEINVGF